MQIQDALTVQKRELDAKFGELYVKRNVSSKNLDSPLIKVIVGPRRAGKSFFAVHLLKEKKVNFGYVNFDDERLAAVENYDDILGAIKVVYGDPQYLLLDEIQNLPKWELFTNRLHRQGFNVFLTGSNSNLLSSELATHLTGRYIPIQILPFSFEEYLSFSAGEVTDSEIKAKLSKYLVAGGYPEPLVRGMDPKEYLSILADSVVYKDIVKRYKIRAVQGIEDLAAYLFSNFACEFSFNQLSKVTGVKSSHTVQKYERYLEEAYLFFSLRRFSYKVKEQLASNRKIYGIDSGLVSAKAFQTSPDWGRLFESAVAGELLRRAADTGIKIYYYKNAQQEEVDFVIKEGTSVVQLIQVCYNLKNSETKKREMRALVKAGSELKCDELFVVNDDMDKTEDVQWFDFRGKIKYVPLWKWLTNS